MLTSVRYLLQSIAPLQRANAPLAAVLDRVRGDLGVGPEWQQTAYGEYYARSADVYAAVKLRADSVARPPLVVQQRDSAGTLMPVGHDHPVQRLLDHANDWWSAGDLISATETYLSLWGSEFWYLSRNELGEVVELWPLRPDRVRIIREGKRYVAGFVYTESGVDFPMLPEEVVWFRYFNPLEEFAGSRPWPRPGCRPTWAWTHCGSTATSSRTALTHRTWSSEPGARSPMTRSRISIAAWRSASRPPPAAHPRRWLATPTSSTCR